LKSLQARYCKAKEVKLLTSHRHNVSPLGSRIYLCIFLLWLPVAEAEQIRVVTEYLHTFQMQNENGTLGGYSVEVVNALFDLTGDKANIEVVPWARAYHEALNDKNVMIFSIAKTPLREKLFKWIGTLSQEKLFVWALKAHIKEPITELTQLKKYTLATSRSSNPEQYLTSKGFNKLFRVSDPNQALGMLFKDRVDLIISAEMSLRHRTKQAGLDFDQLIKVYEITVLNHDLCIAFNLDTDSALIERYQLAFTHLEQNGTLHSLMKKWQVPL
jgi:polar amino acid transport system substrate-binding protein